MRWFFNNIHTIIFLIGLGLFSYGLFLISDIVGFIGSGILLVLLGFYIDLFSR
ncbi:hypothetical protein AF58_00530 [Streptococcus uberis C6344]|nr:hypothetical protein AF58_00530 [Streptococcus uberis C6344]